MAAPVNSPTERAALLVVGIFNQKSQGTLLGRGCYPVCQLAKVPRFVVL